jgi:hypothetical protein
MKKSLLAIVLLITGFTMAFAGSNQELDQGKKTPEEKSIEMKKRDPLDRLNSDLSSIPQNIKNCILRKFLNKEMDYYVL